MLEKIGGPVDERRRLCPYCKKWTWFTRDACKEIDSTLVLPIILSCGIVLLYLYAGWWGFGRPWSCSVCGDLKHKE